ncbi:Uncharacterised protein [Providencia rustigianii]|uniref:Uncharacterized protein n=1 Tax=Providencia rustigianii TaxID=158850 RepID=A0A379G4L5_9GAMM|nr:hypothetical protein [Providencia rustigianii]SUC35841.1 Uncharacterised protein [Providencia rustigianii]
MKTIQIKIVEAFAPGDVITTKTIRDKYSVSPSYASNIIAILTRVDAVKKENVKRGCFAKYTLQANAHEKVMEFEKTASKFRPKAKRERSLSIKEMTSGHCPRIAMFNSLLAEVRKKYE